MQYWCFRPTVWDYRNLRKWSLYYRYGGTQTQTGLPFTSPGLRGRNEMATAGWRAVADPCLPVCHSALVFRGQLSCDDLHERAGEISSRIRAPSTDRLCLEEGRTGTALPTQLLQEAAGGAENGRERASLTAPLPPSLPRSGGTGKRLMPEEGKS